MTYMNFNMEKNMIERVLHDSIQSRTKSGEIKAKQGESPVISNNTMQ